MEWIDIASLVLAVAAFVAAIYGILDVRRHVRDMLTLERNMLYTDVLNKLIYDFIEPTVVSLAFGDMHRFTMVQRALDPKATLDDIQEAANKEALSQCQMFVEHGVAAWKPNIDLGKAREILREWQLEKNAAVMKQIFPKKDGIL